MNKIINYQNKLVIESNNIEFSSNTFITENINISGNIYLDENSEIFANNITGVGGQILKKNAGNLKWTTNSSNGIGITSNNDAIFNNLIINSDASFINRPYQNLLINGVSYEHLDGSYALAIDCAPKVSSQTAKELIKNNISYDISNFNVYSSAWSSERGEWLIIGETLHDFQSVISFGKNFNDLSNNRRLLINTDLKNHVYSASWSPELGKWAVTMNTRYTISYGYRNAYLAMVILTSSFENFIPMLYEPNINMFGIGVQHSNFDVYPISFWWKEYSKWIFIGWNGEYWDGESYWNNGQREYRPNPAINNSYYINIIITGSNPGTSPGYESIIRLLRSDGLKTIETLSWSPERGEWLIAGISRNPALEATSPKNIAIGISLENIRYNLELFNDISNILTSSWSSDLGKWLIGGYNDSPNKGLIAIGKDMNELRDSNNQQELSDFSMVSQSLWVSEFGKWIIGGQSNNSRGIVAIGKNIEEISNNQYIINDLSNILTITWCKEQGQFLIGGEGSLKNIVFTDFGYRLPTKSNIFDDAYLNNVNISGNILFSNTNSNISINTLNANINIVKNYQNNTPVTSNIYVSDDRLKHNEITIKDGLETIRKLNPLFYQKTENFKEPDFSGILIEPYTLEAGFIAQDILDISSLKHSVNIGDNVNAYTLDYNNIFTYGIAGIKELEILVDNIDKKIYQLAEYYNNQIDIINNQTNIINSLNTNSLIVKDKLNKLLEKAGKNYKFFIY